MIKIAICDDEAQYRDRAGRGPWQCEPLVLLPGG